MEPVEAAEIIFSTAKQRTWVVVTSGHVLCVLDDEATENERRWVQWEMTRADAHPIEATTYKRTAGLVRIGRRRDWLCSTHMFRTPLLLEKRLRFMIGGMEDE